MTATLSRGRKIVAALVAAGAIGAVAAPTSASANGWGHHGRGYGYGALGGGLLLGAIIASNSRAEYVGDCWIEKRKLYDADGYPYFQKIRVCN